MAGAQLIVKRAIDYALALVGLVVLSPFFLLTAMAIRLDSPGPVFYIQPRVGKEGRIFSMLKFRTMKPGSPRLFNPDGSTRVTDDDPRLTRVGKFLRRGLDELPQLLNVLKGEMSLVGPRPDEPFHVTLYQGDEKRKLSVLPGITGLPQAMGRRSVPWKERVAMDLYYVDNYSLWLDLKIALRTALALGRKGEDR